MDLFQLFRQHCAAHRLVQPGDRLLLAVSGGLDSTVMLDLFCRLRDQWQEQRQWQLHLAVGHVNHQMRSQESDEDEAFVKALAPAANLPFFSQRVDVPAYAQAHQLSLETAARELRYEALEEFRESWQARAIVTAHTLDDQAETILDHLLRGSGLAGMAGMAAQTKVLRPLLPFSRQQLEEYAGSRELSWREDRTNLDPQFRRNRIRHELVPLLKTRFNPQIARSLERLANIAGAADAYLHAEAEACFSKIIKETQPDKIILDIERFWKYFSIIQLYLIRAVMQKLASKKIEPTFSETARILALMQSPKPAWRNTKKAGLGKRFIWRRQIEVSVDHDGLVFQRLESVEHGAESGKRKAAERRGALPSTLCVSHAVTIGERCPIPGIGMALLVERKVLPRDWRQQVHPHSQFIDAAKAQENLTVRFPQPGDRFVPLGANANLSAGGAKKVSDFFTDLKVPLHRRRSIPILECGNIVWVCGYRLDDRFKITPATRTALHLQLLQMNA